MYYYRLYFLDLDGHRIIDVRDFRANGDAAAIMGAKPLSQNAYKMQLAKVAVKRALLTAAGVKPV